MSDKKFAVRIGYLEPDGSQVSKQKNDIGRSDALAMISDALNADGANKYELVNITLGRLNPPVTADQATKTAEPVRRPAPVPGKKK